MTIAAAVNLSMWLVGLTGIAVAAIQAWRLFRQYKSTSGTR